MASTLTRDRRLQTMTKWLKKHVRQREPRALSAVRERTRDVLSCDCMLERIGAYFRQIYGVKAPVSENSGTLISLHFFVSLFVDNSSSLPVEKRATDYSVASIKYQEFRNL